MELPFRVAFCSGEDLDYKSDELNPEKAAAGPRGWQSPRYGAFPVELGLELRPAHVEQLKLLSHQSKIASRVELFAGEGPAYQQASWRRLGYLSLASNETSRYQARELKTVYLNLSARFLKLLVHECHKNKYNLFNQVGIVALTLLGQPDPAQAPGDAAPPLAGPGRAPGLVAEPKPMEAQAAKARAEFRSAGLGEDLARRIDGVALAKQRAVELEDYDTAKRLKEVEGLLSEMVRHYLGLAEDKFDAVAVEDYDRAKELKLEMADFRELMVRRLGAIEGGARRDDVLAMPAGGGRRHSGGGGGGGQGTRHTDSRELPTTVHHAESQEDAYDDEDPTRGAGAQSASPRRSTGVTPDRYTDDGEDRGPSRFDDADEDDHRPHRDSTPSLGDAAEAAGPSEADRAHPLEGVENCYDLPDPEPLAAPEEFSRWVRVFDEYITRCLRSATWQLRDAALLKCALLVPEEEMAGAELLSVTLQIVAHGLRDKIAQVAYSSLVLLREVVKRCAFEGIGHAQLREAGLEGVFVALSEKVGDGNTRLREQACSALLHMAASPVLGLGCVGAVCCRRMAKKQANNPRSLVARLHLLRDLVESRGLTTSGAFNADHVLGFLATHEAFSHSNAQVRDAARELTVSIYALRGKSAVRPYLEKLRPKQHEEYQAAFELHDEVHGGMAAEPIDETHDAADDSTANQSDEGFQVNAGAGMSATHGDRYGQSAYAAARSTSAASRERKEAGAFDPVIPDPTSDEEDDDEASREEWARPQSSASRSRSTGSRSRSGASRHSSDASRPTSAASRPVSATFRPGQATSRPTSAASRRQTPTEAPRSGELEESDAPGPSEESFEVDTDDPSASDLL